MQSRSFPEILALFSPCAALSLRCGFEGSGLFFLGHELMIAAGFSMTYKLLVDPTVPPILPYPPLPPLPPLSHCPVLFRQVNIP
jgi:hypothetical protein